LKAVKVAVAAIVLVAVAVTTWSVFYAQQIATLEATIAAVDKGVAPPLPSQGLAERP
jgi:hypothetical protein